MRCITCSSPVGQDEVVFAAHPEYQTLQPYCADCTPPDYPEEYQTEEDHPYKEYPT